MPESLDAAARLGITFPAEESFPFRGIRFVDAGGRVQADFRAGSGWGVRRTVLHRTLMDGAERAGVRLLWGTPVTGVRPGVVSLAHGELSARWIVGADGERSRVRLWSGLDPAASGRTRYGFRQHFRVALWTQHMEIYWGEGLQAYMTPVAPDQICLAVISRDSHLRLRHALAQFPELHDRLRGSQELSAERGSVSVMRRLPAVYRGPIALVGDASGSVDAVTGAGLGLGFRHAAALAEALECSDLRRYQREHRRMACRPWLMAELLLAMDRWPAAGARARRLLSARPALFERLLAFHAGGTATLDEIDMLSAADRSGRYGGSRGESSATV